HGYRPFRPTWRKIEGDAVVHKLSVVFVVGEHANGDFELKIVVESRGKSKRRASCRRSRIEKRVGYRPRCRLIFEIVDFVNVEVFVQFSHGEERNDDRVSRVYAKSWSECF